LCSVPVEYLGRRACGSVATVIVPLAAKFLSANERKHKFVPHLLLTNDCFEKDAQNGISH